MNERARPAPRRERVLLQDGTEVDLVGCAEEPIHVPGAIQPHGWLLSVDSAFVVQHASANIDALVPGGAPEVLGRPLEAVVGTTAATLVRQHVAVFSDLRQRNPLHLVVDTPNGRLEVDAVLHRPGTGTAAGTGTDDLLPLVVMELEAAIGERPFSFANTYQAVRGSVARLNRTADLTDLYQAAAEEVRALTGFDRVMVYRFDESYNGEVVAEAAADDLDPWLGLHYPAGDIPAQARRLYELSWMRIIAEVPYEPVPLLGLPGAASPLDLTYSTLRSVSPVHVEYLGNMRVRSSMSLSLLQDGRLWGLIACHHYSGSHLPPYGVRAAAEFLGSTLSLRLVDRAGDEEQQRALAAEKALLGLVSGLGDEEQHLADVLRGDPGTAAASGVGPVGALDLVAGDGLLVEVDGRRLTHGLTPPGQDLDALVARLCADGRELVAVRSVAEEAPELLPLVGPDVAGLLALVLTDGQVAVWFRAEDPARRRWGGDPDAKTLVVDGDVARLGPRRSFETWQETVRGHALPWRDAEVVAARRLRVHLLEALYARARQRVRAAEVVQRSLLPARLPQPDGWSLDASYDPAPGGRVGGDWYDALQTPDGRLLLVVGDVAGHGLHAAAAMAQLRHALRAFLVRGESPQDAVTALDRHVTPLVPDHMATLSVVSLDLATGTGEALSYGHVPPLVARADGPAHLLEVDSTPPIGLGLGMSEAVGTSFHLDPGDALVLYTDGLVERRGDSLQAGLDRLVLAVQENHEVADIVRRAASGREGDDVTMLMLRRA